MEPRIEVGEIALKPLAFDILDFDPIETGMRYGAEATPLCASSGYWRSCENWTLFRFG